MSEFVRVETSSGVATIRVDRPKMNAINPQMLEELTDAANTIAADDSVRAAVVWGGPKIFAAGADIGGFTGLEPAAGQGAVGVLQRRLPGGGEHAPDHRVGGERLRARRRHGAGHGDRLPGRGRRRHIRTARDPSRYHPRRRRHAAAAAAGGHKPRQGDHLHRAQRRL